MPKRAGQPANGKFIRAMGAPSGPTRLRAPKRVLTSTSPSSAPPAAVSQPQQLAFHVALTRLTRAATRATRQQPRSLQHAVNLLVRPGNEILIRE